MIGAVSFCVTSGGATQAAQLFSPNLSLIPAIWRVPMALQCTQSHRSSRAENIQLYWALDLSSIFISDQDHSVMRLNKAIYS